MKLTSCLVVLSLLSLATGPVAAQKGTHHQVVIEVTTREPEAWNGVLNNIENLQKAFGPDAVKIESVSHGKGLGLLLKTDTTMQPRLEQAVAHGVVFAACHNTMNRQHVKKDDLFPFVTVVDSGVAEVVRKQEAGWSYLKAGG